MHATVTPAPSPKLFVAMPCYGSVPVPVIQSLEELNATPPCSVLIRLTTGDSLVSHARNALTADFLATDRTHLLFIDSDIAFTCDQVARLVSHDEAVVGGLYAKKQASLELACEGFPDEPPVDHRGLLPVRHIGAGFLLIKREVFERMIDEFAPEICYTAYGTSRQEYDFWHAGVRENQDGTRRYLSEDWGFCQRARDINYTVYADTGVHLQHIGTATYPLTNQYVEKRQPNADVERPVRPVYHNYNYTEEPKGGKILQLIPEPEEVWDNGTYWVIVTMREDGSVRRLSIRRRDWGTASDWRDLQAIKNQICGPECEAAELYPAESRVVDKMNFSHLWVLRPGERFPFGFIDGEKSEGHPIVQRALTQRGDCGPLVRVKESNLPVTLPANKNSIAEPQQRLAAIPEGSAAE